MGRRRGKGRPGWSRSGRAGEGPACVRRLLGTWSPRECAPGCTPGPWGEWAAAVPDLDCQTNFFSFFLVVVTSKTGNNSEKKAWLWSCCSALPLRSSFLRFCFSSLWTCFSPLGSKQLSPP